ncbi:MAG: hypothetical protein R3A48_11670 [Polyangiales bacterium]
MRAPARRQLDLARRVVEASLDALVRPITIRGHAYTAFPCCEAPKHALAWSVAEAEVARGAWGALAAKGAIPEAWRDDPARRFACPVCVRARRHAARHPRSWHRGPAQTCPLCRGVDLAAPATCADCVAFASDPEGVAAAEARVRELADALTPWGARPPGVLFWRTRATPRAVRCAPLRSACEAAALAQRRPGEPPPSLATEDARRTAWREAVAGGLQVGARAGGPPAPTGVAFADLPDPFEALTELAALGYALEELTERDAVLVAPPASLEGAGFGARLLLQDFGGTRPGARRHSH